MTDTLSNLLFTCRLNPALVTALFIAALAPNPASAAPKAVFNPEKVSFGLVNQGEVPQQSIEVVNQGDAPLEITGIRSSCPCVVVDLPADQSPVTILPGGSDRISVLYDTEGYYGERAAMIMIESNDPEKPLASLDVEIDIIARVLTNPEKVFNWSMVPRGEQISDPLLIFAGDGSNHIELLDIAMDEPTMTVEAQLETTKAGNRLRAHFRVAPDVPLGTLTNRVTARVQVSGEEVTIEMPVKGEVVGDVLVMPPSIVCAPRLAYERNQPLSEQGIIVRASRPDAPLPDVLGVIAVGPLKAVVHKNVTPEWGNTPDRHIVEVRTAGSVGAGAQGGTVHIMTTSTDQPIVSIPVFFRMGAQCVPDPAHVVLEPARGAEATARVTLHDTGGAPFSVQELKFEEDLLTVEVEQSEPTAYPVLVFRAAKVPPPERMATIVAVHTTLPEEDRVLIPVLIRTPQPAPALASAAR